MRCFDITRPKVHTSESWTLPQARFTNETRSSIGRERYELRISIWESLFLPPYLGLSYLYLKIN